MAVLKRSATPAPNLKPATIAILLDGWGAEAPITPGENAFARNGFGGGMLEVFEPDGPARLWRAHEEYLRQVAARWGWTPSVVGPDGTPRFFAEHLAAGFAAHEARDDDDDPDDDDDQ